MRNANIKSAAKAFLIWFEHQETLMPLKFFAFIGVFHAWLWDAIKAFMQTGFDPWSRKDK